MKKMIMAILFVLGTSLAASAQWRDYYCELPEGVYFNGNQWHYENFSVIGTNRANQYLIARSGGYSELVYVPAQRVLLEHTPKGIEVFDCTPYPSGSVGYWFVSTDRGFFFVDEYGNWNRTSGVKYYGTLYRYSLRGGILNFMSWHLHPDYSNRSSYSNGQRYNNNQRYNSSRTNYDRRPTGSATRTSPSVAPTSSGRGKRDVIPNGMKRK